jgi:hypothetical protein
MLHQSRRLSHTKMQKQPVAAARRIDTIAEGEQLITRLAGVLEGLLAIVEQETELTRQGRIAQVAELAEKKAELARLYYAATEQVKANAAFLKAKLPARMSELKLQHDMFGSLLQINLTVLATVHAVSEGIIRGVAGEMARKAAPQTYGMSGRPASVAPTMSNPVALLRTL